MLIYIDGNNMNMRGLNDLLSRVLKTEVNGKQNKKTVLGV